MIPPNDATALANAIQHFYDHPEDLVTMGRSGRERVIKQFTWRHYHNRVGQAYAYAMKRST